MAIADRWCLGLQIYRLGNFLRANIASLELLTMHTLIDGWTNCAKTTYARQQQQSTTGGLFSAKNHHRFMITMLRSTADTPAQLWTSGLHMCTPVPELQYCIYVFLLPGQTHMAGLRAAIARAYTPRYAYKI